MHASTCLLCLPTDNPQAASLPPETPLVSLLAPQSPGRSPGRLPKLRAASKKNGERRACSGRRSTKHLKDSPAPLTVTNQTRGGGDAGGGTVQGYVAELSTQARDSLRWEGALEDPQAEEERMELYRANRRQRYISHREALLKESQCALRQTFPTEGK